MNQASLFTPHHCSHKIDAARWRVACSLATLLAVSLAFAVGCAVSQPAPAATSALVSAPVGSVSRSATGDGGRNLTVRAPSAATAPLVQPWKSETRDGHEIITDHSRIRTTIKNGDLRKFLPIFTENALVQYTSALVDLPAPTNRLETYIFGSRDEWVAFTRDRLGEDAQTYLGLGRGGYTSNSVAILYDIGPTDTLTILAHEGWHQYSQSVFRQELPVWLEEGISTYMEGYRVDSAGQPVFAAWRNFERFGELRDAVRRERLIPLEKLLDHTPQQFLNEGREQLLIYYAQVWALTHFLAEGDGGKYREALKEMLNDAVAGKVGSSLAERMGTDEDRRSVQRGISRGGLRSLPGTLVVRGYFSQNLSTLAAEYDAFLRQICARGSGDAIWKGVSPIPAELPK